MDNVDNVQKILCIKENCAYPGVDNCVNKVDYIIFLVFYVTYTSFLFKKYNKSIEFVTKEFYGK